jgi:type IV secretory pathway VirB10-like protein
MRRAFIFRKHMREPQQQTLHADEEATVVVGGEETTLVAPRFDDEETMVARPVVPLDTDAPADAGQDSPAAHFAPARRRLYAPRRSWMLALVLVSVLVGGILGGAGLYLYQRQSNDPAVSPSATTAQPEPPADSAQSAPAAEGQAVTPSDTAAPQAETPAPSEPNAGEPAPPARVEPARVEEAPAAPSAREPESVPAAERREAPAAGGDTGTPKRGKKGERDAEMERRAAPRPGGNVARADEPEARRVDSISYRPRRAERQAERRAARRARREDDMDRLRRIFEGTPQ